MFSSLGWPQRPINVTIDPTGEHSRVCLSYLGATAQTNFAEVFRIPLSLECKPYLLHWALRAITKALRRDGLHIERHPAGTAPYT